MPTHFPPVERHAVAQPGKLSVAALPSGDRRGGGHGHRPRGAARPAARGERLLSSGEDLEALDRSQLRAQEEPHPRALRARRAGQSDRHLPPRVRAAEHPAPARREGVGAANETQTDPRYLQASTRRQAHARRLRRRPRRLYGHITKRKTRAEFLAFCRYIRSLYPPQTRLHFIVGNFSPTSKNRSATGPTTTTTLSSPTHPTTAPG